jgi:nitrilase
MPLLRQAMYAEGVEIYCAPTVDDRDVWQHTMRHIALERRCFVLASCQYIRRSDYPDDYASQIPAGQDDALIRGGSVIVDPLGQLLAGPHVRRGMRSTRTDPGLDRDVLSPVPSVERRIVQVRRA